MRVYNVFKISLTARLSIAALVAVVLCGCSREGEYRTIEGMIWNTAYHITYCSDKELSDSVIAELQKVEESVSVFTPGSVVDRVNASEEMAVDSIFAEVYRSSLRISRESEGYFDPTLAPLIEAYGFAGKEGRIPDAAATDSIISFVGIEKSSLLDGVLRKSDPRLRFNFSAIAKGYGCDAVGAMLRRNGCNDYLVEIGGEIAASGENASGGAWRIQVDKPVFSADSVVHSAQLVIEITDCGVATSGNYRNYRDDGSGRRVGHTFDPHTGAPAVNDMLSATIVAPDCMDADAYATACMAMGFDKACAMVRRLRLKALLINSDGKVWMSEGFKQIVNTK